MNVQEALEAPEVQDNLLLTNVCLITSLREGHCYQGVGITDEINMLRTKEKKAGVTTTITMGMVWMVICLGLVACKSTPASEPLEQYEVDELRGSVRDMASLTLSQLYRQYPDAQSRVQRSAGYGVFSDSGFKFLFMGSAAAHGVVINNATRQETFMAMVELQSGYGFGAQQFKIVLIFETQEILNAFVNFGWEFGRSAAAGAQTVSQSAGSAMGVSVSPGVTLYQISEEGTAVGVSITGARFYRDNRLN